MTIRSVRYVYPGGDEIIISHRLIRFVWQALTADPARTMRSMANEYGLRSTGGVSTAIQILRERGIISAPRREIYRPYTDESEFS